MIKVLRDLMSNSSLYLRTGSLASSTARKLSSSTAQDRAPEEQKISVNGVSINYVRTGTGEHPVLLLPGAIGSAWTDFSPQIKSLDREKFTIVAWDPPGYGKSRPPDRTFPDDFFQRDANWAHDLMKNLGYEYFSLIGWSDGGITSLILASVYPNSVRKMVTIGANAYIAPEEVEIYKKYRDIDTWSEKMKAPMIEVYGEEYFRKTWSDWVDAVLRIYEKQNGNLCKEGLSRIQCSTLVVQGAKDAMVAPEHPTYLKDHITDAKLKIFEKGAHNVHLRYPEMFNDLVTEFLLEESKM